MTKVHAASKNHLSSVESLPLSIVNHEIGHKMSIENGHERATYLNNERKDR